MSICIIQYVLWPNNIGCLFLAVRQNLLVSLISFIVTPGQYSVPSLDGSQYFLTIVDDYSRMTWTTYLLHDKSQTRSIIQSFYHLI